MSFTTIVGSKFFRGVSFLVAASTTYAPSATGFNALFGAPQDTVRQIARMPRGHYTNAPGEPYLGNHPGRDRGRGFWSKEALSNADISSSNVEASIDPSNFSISHTLAVSPSPGAPLPWEGRLRLLDHSIVNTANGDRLFTINLMKWKSRGPGRRLHHLSK